MGVEPANLSMIERGVVRWPLEATLVRLPDELSEDPDVILALAAKVSSDLQEVIRKRPRLFSQLLRELQGAPSDAILRIMGEVRDTGVAKL